MNTRRHWTDALAVHRALALLSRYRQGTWIRPLTFPVVLLPVLTGWWCHLNASQAALVLIVVVFYHFRALTSRSGGRWLAPEGALRLQGAALQLLSLLLVFKSSQVNSTTGSLMLMVLGALAMLAGIVPVTAELAEVQRSRVLLERQER